MTVLSFEPVIIDFAAEAELRRREIAQRNREAAEARKPVLGAQASEPKESD